MMVSSSYKYYTRRFMVNLRLNVWEEVSVMGIENRLLQFTLLA